MFVVCFIYLKPLRLQDSKIYLTILPPLSLVYPRGFHKFITFIFKLFTFGSLFCLLDMLVSSCPNVKNS
jgi:hypothetical protein